MTDKNITARIDEDLWSRFRVAAIGQGVTVSRLLSDAIEEKITALENKRKRAQNKKTGNKLIINEETGPSRAPVNKLNKHFNSTVKELRTINKPINKTKPPKGTPTERKNPYLRVQDAYNVTAEQHSRKDNLPGFKLCRRLSANRKRGIDRLLKELGEDTTPSEFFLLCCKNRHWRGDNDRRWRADIEFLTRDENISKALELDDSDSHKHEQAAPVFFPEDEQIIDVTITEQRGEPWQVSGH